MQRIKTNPKSNENKNENKKEQDSESTLNDYKQEKYLEEKIDQIRNLIINNKLYFDKIRGIINYSCWFEIKQRKRKVKRKISIKKLKQIYCFMEENFIILFMLVNFLSRILRSSSWRFSKQNLNLIRIELSIKKFKDRSKELNKKFSKQFSYLNPKAKANNCTHYCSADSYKQKTFEKAFVKYEAIIEENHALIQKLEILIENVLNFIFTFESTESNNFNLKKFLIFFSNEISKLKAIKKKNEEEFKIENEYFYLKYLNLNNYHNKDLKKVEKISIASENLFSDLSYLTEDSVLIKAKVGKDFLQNLHKRKDKFTGSLVENNHINLTNNEILLEYYEKQFAEVNQDITKIEKELCHENKIDDDNDNDDSNTNTLNLDFFNKLQQKTSLYQKLLETLISKIEILNVINSKEYLQIIHEKETEINNKNFKLENDLEAVLKINKGLNLEVNEKNDQIETLKNINKQLKNNNNNLEEYYYYHQKEKELNSALNENFETEKKQYPETMKIKNYEICEEIKLDYEVNTNENSSGGLPILNNYLNMSHIYAKDPFEKSVCSLTKEAADWDLVKKTNANYLININNSNNYNKKKNVFFNFNYSNTNKFNTYNKNNIYDKATTTNTETKYAFARTNTPTHFDNNTKECSGKVYQEYANKISTEKIIYSNTNTNINNNNINNINNNKFCYLNYQNPGEHQNKLVNDNQQNNNEIYSSNDNFEFYYNERNNSSLEDYWEAANRNLLCEEAQLLLNEINIYKKIISEKEENISSLERKVICLREDIHSFTQRKFLCRDLFVISKQFQLNSSENNEHHGLNSYRNNIIKQFEDDLLDYKIIVKNLNFELAENCKINKEQEEIIAYKDRNISLLRKEINALKEKSQSNTNINDSYLAIRVINIYKLFIK